MPKERSEILVDSIKRLLRRGAIKQLHNIIAKTHMADLSMVIRELTPDNRYKLFELIDDIEKQAVLFSKLDSNIFLEFAKNIGTEKLVKIFEKMPSDDAAELLNILDQKIADEIIAKMQIKESENVVQLMSYEEDTAGSIMVTDFIALNEDMKARQVIDSLQSKYLDVEMPFYIYVVDEYRRLVGISSLRQLVVVPPEKPLKDFMNRDIISVKTYTDREEVAKIVSRYDYLAVPVIDDENKIVGIVTVDDVIDILHDSATEDILKMAGVGEDYIETQTVIGGTRTRLPWLFASFIGGVTACFIIGRFQSSIVKVAYLAAFIPVITGMGGNIGIQSSTIVVRGIATGKINVRDFWKIVLKELSIGLILGFVYGSFIGLVAKIKCWDLPIGWPLSVSVSLGVLTSMTLAAIVGSVVPLLLERIKVDPAIATGPFVTTTIDIVGVYCYFTIASFLLGFS